MRTLGGGSHTLQVNGLEEQLSDVQIEIDKLQAQSQAAELIAERMARMVFPNLIQTTDAYRSPEGHQPLLDQLFDVFLSESMAEQEAVRRLGVRLVDAGLFGDDKTA